MRCRVKLAQATADLSVTAAKKKVEGLAAAVQAQQAAGLQPSAPVQAAAGLLNAQADAHVALAKAQAAAATVSGGELSG